MSPKQESASNVISEGLGGATLAGIEAWEHGWAFRFSSSATVTTETIWRVISDDGIIVTSEDHQQRFGLPEPLDAGERAKAALTGKVTSINIAPASSDLLLGFGSKVLQFINTSAGYEGWHFVAQVKEQSPREVVALGGGGLAIW